MSRCSFEAATAILIELVSVLAACFPLYGAAEMEPVNYGKCKHLSSFQYRRTLPCVCVCVCLFIVRVPVEFVAFSCFEQRRQSTLVNYRSDGFQFNGVQSCS